MTSLLSPESRASSIPYCRIGLSTSGSISFGMTFVAGKNRVPKPAQGKTQVRRGEVIREGRISQVATGLVALVGSWRFAFLIDLRARDRKAEGRRQKAEGRSKKPARPGCFSIL